ncbi:hypothetical protein GCM10010429_48920 [Micromonospora olivasterospora]|uniref:Uncharacterized protein n=1 Tax=Micromonospora olivasterospora TaxID=1880 RepID=A0A562III5_MICOL|nr:hypothetical protein [Micromonospora olivasterospora]TWH70626.1 hypothetical protein JD77_05651 [Micromonospora olivasterospora]
MRTGERPQLGNELSMSAEPQLDLGALFDRGQSQLFQTHRVQVDRAARQTGQRASAPQPQRVAIANAAPQVLGPALAAPIVVSPGGYPLLFSVTGAVTLLSGLLVTRIRQVRWRPHRPAEPRCC